MTLIKSISGIRGTIGGREGDGLTPNDIVKFVGAFGFWLKSKSETNRKVVIGRDARISGDVVSKLVCGTLQALGLDVVDLGLSTTPTVEIAVTTEKAVGGIILTASHNPKEWNALKLLNQLGEFVSASDIQEVLVLAENGNYEYADVDVLGSYSLKPDYFSIHIDIIKALPLVTVDAVKSKKFKVAIDAVNSTGGLAVPLLLKSLGVEDIHLLNCEPNGQFAHNPEPLTENLTELTEVMATGKYDLGIAIDPDVDRLVLICENGEPFNEEYTLVAVADYVLQHTKGNTVSNLSSTKALRDITERRGGQYFASAVGEVNVVEKMKEVGAVIGGEGNGGVIYPELHSGRDALVGIALLLSYLATENVTLSGLKTTYPRYYMHKSKVNLSPELSFDAISEKVNEKYVGKEMITVDGIKIHLDSQSWVHLRKSNTEPIMRIYSEAESAEKAQEIANEVKELLK